MDKTIRLIIVTALLAASHTGAKQNKKTKTAEPSVPFKTFILPEASRPEISENHQDWFIEVAPSDKIFKSEKLTVESPKESFYISRFEVTQGLWEKVMDENPSEFKDSKNLPVDNASWMQMVLFCNRLSKLDGLTPCYYTDEGFTEVLEDPATKGTQIFWKKDANGYRLPTADEWVYAAKGGGLSQDFGMAGANKEDADFVAWFRKNSGGRTHEVGQKRPNELGIYDMAGNVFELCWDLFRGEKGSRVRHGSGFEGTESRCAIMNRRGVGETGGRNYIGFRLAKNK